MDTESLKDLFIDELKDLYSAENQLIKALPKMAKAASCKDLKSAFTEHLAQTKEHAERLEQICDALDASPKGKKCKGMEGLIEEGKEAIDEYSEPEVLDAALISAAQRVEHYEMAGYGCVRTYAELLGEKESARILQQTLDEEGAADKKLTQLAGKINIEAKAPDGAQHNGKNGRASRKRSTKSHRAGAR